MFFPASMAGQEMAGSWEPGRTALVLVAWSAVGLGGFFPDGSAAAVAGIVPAALVAGALAARRRLVTGRLIAIALAAVVAASAGVVALRAALKRLLGDPGLRRRLGAAARERIKEHFAWPAVTDATIAAYEEALRQASNPDDFALRVSGIASTSDAKWDDFEAMGTGTTAPVPGTSDFGSSTQRPSSEPPQAAPAAGDDDFKIERF